MRKTTVGMILTAVSLSGFAVTVWRFDWLRRYVPFLLYWGRWPWRFPASRIGVTTGFITGIVIGCFCLDSKFQFLSKAIWLFIMVFVLISLITAAIHDYVLYQRNKSKHNKQH